MSSNARRSNTPPKPTCAWQDCDWVTYADFPICMRHVIHVVDYVQTAAPKDELLILNRARLHTQQDAAAYHKAKAERDIRATRGTQPGWIYYVHTDGKIKIGYSSNITARLKAYAPGSVILAVHPGTPDLEKRMHQQFAAYLIAGREWFSPVEEILEHCKSVTAQYGDPARFAPRVRNKHDQVVGVRNMRSIKKTAA